MRKIVVDHQPDARRRDAGAGPARRGQRGGFEHGGWAVPYSDPVMMQAMGEGMARAPICCSAAARTRTSTRSGPGARTTRSPRCSTTRRSTSPRRTLREPLPWQNSTLLPGDAAETVARLKEQPGKDIVVLGSGDLLQTLMRHGLVDAVRAADPPAGARAGPPAVRRRRAARGAPPREERDHDHRRRDRDATSQPDRGRGHRRDERR